MYKTTLAATAAALAFTVTPAHAAQTGIVADVSFAQCVYTNRSHTDYTTTRDLAVTNTGTEVDRVKVTVYRNGNTVRSLVVVLSPNTRYDVFVNVKTGQYKDVVVKHTGGYSEVFRLGHRSVCGE